MNTPIFVLTAAALVLGSAAAMSVEPGTSTAGNTGMSGRAGAFSFDAGVGIKHDSNVAVLELDTSSNEGDYAALLDLGLGYQHALTDKATVEVDYALSHTEYDEFTDFNLTIHRGSVDLGYDFEVLDAGVTYHHIDARLDGDGFLTMKQASPYVARLVSKRLYLRGAYIWTDKRFDGNPLRDATADAVSGDAFVFLNGLSTYLVLGYRHSLEDAEDPQFDYRGHQLSAQINQQVPLFGVDARLRSRLRYETRSYDNVTTAIGEKRDDDRYRFDLSLAVPLGEAVTTTAQYEYADNRSNLDSVDFSEHVVSLRFDLSL